MAAELSTSAFRPDANVPSKERILLAAKHLFAQDGYENTSTSSIARLAGTSESQLMKHFGSKEGLLEAIFDYGWQNMAYIFRAIHELPTAAEKLESMLELIINALDRDQELKELMLLEGRRIRKEGHMVLITEGYKTFIKTVDAILIEMRAKGEMNPELKVEAVRSAMTSMFEGMLRDQILARRMDFPAVYDVADMKRIFRVVLSSLAPAAARR